MKIAIVGSGVSGLTVAERLHRRHQVTLYEAEDRLGGHAYTLDLDLGADGTLAVDTGFMVFNDRNYPGFEGLLARLGIDRQRSDMSFSVADEAGRFEYTGASLNGLFATRRNLFSPRFYRMLGDVVRFQRAGRELVRSERDPSLGEWLEEQRFSPYFVERLIVPQLSAVWSADPAELGNFSARFLLTFFDRHGMLGLTGRPRWWTIPGGSRRYVMAIANALGERVRVGTAVERVARDEQGVTVYDRWGGVERYDAVVLATHSDQALSLLEQPTAAEQEVLGAIPYLDNEIVVHTDRNLLPRRRAAWASWNFHLLEEPKDRPTVTYYLNRLQRLRCSHQVLATLNRSEAINPNLILARFTFSHPVFTRAAVRAQQRFEEISGKNRTFYCGAYWFYGFHEDGVRSGLRVVNQIEGDQRWRLPLTAATSSIGGS